MSAELAPVLLPQRAVVDEGICEGIEARIACFTVNPALPVELFIGMPVALSMATAGGSKRLFPLIITEAIPTTSSTQELSVVNLVARDPMYFVNERKQLRTVKNARVQDVVDVVLAEWINNSPIAGSFTYRFLTADSGRYPRRACYLQHPDESDAQFVFRLLRSDGWSWYWAVKTDSRGSVNIDGVGVPQLELVIFDDSILLSANDMPSMQYHRRDGAPLRDAIELIAAVYQVVPDGIDAESWDHETGRLTSSSADTGVNQGERGNRLARAMRSTRYAIDHLGDNAADGDRLVNVQADHYRFRSHCLRGRGDVRTMSPGTYQVIDSYPLFAGRSVEACTYTTVRVTHIAENNLPVELHEAAQALAGDPGLPEWAKTEAGAEKAQADKSKNRYTNQFYCVPRGTPILPSYVEERDSPRRRRLTGIVITYDQNETATDELGRVLVRLLGGKPGADTTVWVRSAVSWGGKDHGHFGVLRAGTEVDIEVLGPDRLAIVGVRYNQSTPPPRWDHLDGLPANDAYSGTISRELNSTRQQQLRFDDTPGNISVQLGTDDAVTQLNIGSLSTPKNNGRNQRRGRGYELRTNAQGVHRAGGGMLITTEERNSATEHITDMPETVDRLGQGNDQHQSLSDAAHQAQAQQSGDQDDVVSALQTQLKEVKGEGSVDPARGQFPEFRTPHLLLASPAGLETSTQGSTHLVSTEHIALTSGGHTSVSANKSLLVSAKAAIKLFAYNAGMKLVAAASDIDITALKNSIHILAKLDITLTANRITIAAKEEVLINGGGSSTRWNGSGIVHGTNGACRQQAASHTFSGPANAAPPELKSADVALKETPPEDQVAFSMQHIPDQSPLLFAGQAYTLLKNGAEVKKGLFDEYGRMTVDKAEKGARYQVKLHNGTVHEVPVAADKMASDPADPRYNEQQLSNKGYRADGQTGDERLAQRDRGVVVDSPTLDA